MATNTNEKQLQTTVILPRQLRAELHELSAKTGAPMGAIMRLALASYIEQYKEREAA